MHARVYFQPDAGPSSGSQRADPLELLGSVHNGIQLIGPDLIPLGRFKGAFKQ